MATPPKRVKLPAAAAQPLAALRPAASRPPPGTIWPATRRAVAGCPLGGRRPLAGHRPNTDQTQGSHQPLSAHQELADCLANIKVNAYIKTNTKHTYKCLQSHKYHQPMLEKIALTNAT